MGIVTVLILIVRKKSSERFTDVPEVTQQLTCDTYHHGAGFLGYKLKMYRWSLYLKNFVPVLQIEEDK